LSDAVMARVSDLFCFRLEETKNVVCLSIYFRRLLFTY